ncbi:hypothetical protein BJF78_34700 [Pseudonocardia sp. CNS-139]|nr:hypothetical protein BJF78_34700 [Pseudonocardia sp. CNS-139]
MSELYECTDAGLMQVRVVPAADVLIDEDEAADAEAMGRVAVVLGDPYDAALAVIGTEAQLLAWAGLVAALVGMAVQPNTSGSAGDGAGDSAGDGVPS